MAPGPAEVAHGPMFIGVVFNLILYGIMITQTFLYFTTYKRDQTWMKVFVLMLFIADTVNSVFDLIYLYDSLILHFADVKFLERANWVFGTDPAMTGIIATAVQLFFAWRVKVLTGNYFLVIAIAATSIASLLCSIATAIAVGIVPEFINFQKFQVVVIIWLVCASIADVIITFALVWHLRQHKTGFATTDDLVNKIIRITVQTGLVTSLWATIDLIVYLADPTGLHLLFNMPLSKLYTNSLMSSLNSRGGWNFSFSTEATIRTERELKTASVDVLGRRADVVQLGTNTRPEVFVHVEHHEMVDRADTDAASDKAGTGVLADIPGSQGWETDVKDHGSMV